MKLVLDLYKNEFEFDYKNIDGLTFIVNNTGKKYFACLKVFNEYESMVKIEKSETNEFVFKELNKCYSPKVIEIFVYYQGEKNTEEIRIGKIVFLDKPTFIQEPIKIVPNGGACRMFLDWGIIGDSLASGELEGIAEDGSIDYVDLYEYSYASYMSRLLGVKVTNYSKGGQSAKSIYVENKWNVLESNHNVYIIALGSNDAARLDTEYKLGWGDINTDVCLDDLNKNLDSFVGWYAKIIQRLRQNNPHCFIFMMTRPRGSNIEHIEALKAISNKFKKCYLVNMEPYKNIMQDKHMMANHFDTNGYAIYSDYVMTAIDKVINDNINDFRQVGFLGTKYKNKNYPY